MRKGIENTMTMNKEEVEIDGREENSDLCLVLDLLGMPYVKKQLPYGDIVFPRFDFGIELKRNTVEGRNDLRESFFDNNHLYQQLHDLKRTFQRSALLIQDETGGKIFDTHFTPQHWRSIKDTINAHYNIPMIFTSSTRETIQQIYALYDKLVVKASEDEYDYSIHHEKRPRTLHEKRIYLISGLEGLGKEKTRTLIMELETPDRVNEWIKNNGFIDGAFLKIPGFGPKFFANNQLLMGFNK
jgi:ERCC4-type nuclease